MKWKTKRAKGLAAEIDLGNTGRKPKLAMIEIDDKGIAADVTETLRAAGKLQIAEIDPKRAVRLSDAERAARREKNRLRRRRRSQAATAAQKGMSDWKARAKAQRRGA